MSVCLRVFASQVLCVSALFSPLHADEVVYPFLNGKGESKAMSFAIGPETRVSIAIVGVDVNQAKIEGKPIDIICHDPESRLLLFKSKGKADFEKWGKSREIQPGEAFYSALDAKGELSRVVSLDFTFNDKVLPLAFFRVRHQGNAPEPGQPLYNKAGELVAISHQVTPSDPQTAYALPVEALAKVYKVNQAGKPVRRCWVGCHLDATDPFAKVVGIRPDSPASKAGLEKGDILIQAGDWKLQNYPEAVNAFYYFVSGNEVSFKVLRGVRLIDLKVTPMEDPRYSVLPPSDLEEKKEEAQ